MFKKIKLRILIPLLLVGAFLEIGHQWGLWSYIASVAGPINPSPNENKRSGTLIYKGKAKGEAILVHGLNFEADKMFPVGMLLHSAGYSVKIPRLAGHRGDVSETLSDPTQAWNEEFTNLETNAQKPLVCAGYSMGGLLVLERYLAHQLSCSKFVFFAPALKLYTPKFGVQLLRSILPADFQIPSGIPDDYKHFAKLGLSTSWAVADANHRLMEQLEKVDGKSVPPALVFLDMRDQVVDAQAARELIREKFPHWRVVEVNAIDLPERHAFHLIVDEIHVGKEQWKKIGEEISEFLKQ